MPFLPYQDHLDTLQAIVTHLRGWDGEAIKTVRKPQDLPQEAKQYIAYLSGQIAPVIFATGGKEMDNYISWIPGLS